MKATYKIVGILSKYNEGWNLILKIKKNMSLQSGIIQLITTLITENVNNH